MARARLSGAGHCLWVQVRVSGALTVGYGPRPPLPLIPRLIFDDLDVSGPAATVVLGEELFRPERLLREMKPFTGYPAADPRDRPV